MKDKAQHSLPILPLIMIKQLMVTKGLQVTAAILRQRKRGKIVQILARHTQHEAGNKFRASVCVGPCIARQFIVDIAEQAGIALTKEFEFSGLDFPRALPFHFLEVLPRRDSCSQRVCVVGTKGSQIFTVEDNDVKALKIQELVHQPEERMLERLRRTES